MITFLPYPDFVKSAKVLDTRRLTNQVKETYAIWQATTDPEFGWQKHPAVIMWMGYQEALIAYGLAMVKECTARKRYSEFDSFFEYRFNREHTTQEFNNLSTFMELPPFIGDTKFHTSHRNALLVKNPRWYGDLGWVEGLVALARPPKIAYFWPVRHVRFTWIFASMRYFEIYYPKLDIQDGDVCSVIGA